MADRNERKAKSQRMLSDRLIELVTSVSFEGIAIPEGVRVLDPMHGENSSEVDRIVRGFHHKFFCDDHARNLILGINPGRLGAGSTGLCFTDTKRCESDLDIPVHGFRTHEPSSDFFYRVVRAMGGATAFYNSFYVQAICPLGFTQTGPNGSPVNLNYYDDASLCTAITPFVVGWLKALVAAGMRTDRVFCIGTGKNLEYLTRINTSHALFGQIVALEHPRFIMQYKARQMETYIAKYVDTLSSKA
jgi:hypothetical protein